MSNVKGLSKEWDREEIRMSGTERETGMLDY